METKTLNRLYSNLMANMQVQGAWRYRVFENTKGRILRELIMECLRNDSLHIEVLKDLKTSLQVALTYQRILISTNPEQNFWIEFVSELENRCMLSKNYLDSDMTQKVQQVVDYIKDSAGEITRALTEVVQEEILSVEGRCLLIPETARIGHLYRAWIEENKMENKVSVLTNKGDIAIEIVEDYELLLFPGSPSRYIARPSFDIYLRSLLLSGVSSRVTFVSPTWSYSNSDMKLPEMLVPGLTLESIPVLQVLGLENDLESKNELSIELWEIEDSFSSNKTYELFEAGGSVPCLLISLGDNLVYPIEEDAKRVTVLVKDIERGIWKIDSRNPFSDLKDNEFLVACVGRSETQDLRSRAARKMGNAFQEYVIQQKEWKARLEDLFRQGSPVEIESKLLDSGVVKSNRARYWISPESIQPASRTDFIALLKYLKFSREEIDVITKLTSAYDSLLIAEGREASKAIADTLEEFEYSQLDLGRPVEITLENYGDATYLIAPHHGILEVDIHCRPSQVRQVIQYSVEEKSL